MFQKKLIAFALTFAMMAGTAPALAASTTFSDVPDDHWAANEIREMAEKGIVNGIGNGQFVPEGTVTYSEFLKMITVQFYSNKIQTGYGSSWYDPYMKAAEDASILSGVSAVATSTLNRYEMAQIMYNVMKANNIQISKLTDTSKVSDWASVPANYQDAVSACYQMNLLTGVDAAGTYNGLGTMTRAQAAVVMSRLISKGTTTSLIPDGALLITGDNVYKLDHAAWDSEKERFILSRDVLDSGTAALIYIDVSGYSTLTFTVLTHDIGSNTFGPLTQFVSSGIAYSRSSTGFDHIGPEYPSNEVPETYTLDLTGMSYAVIQVGASTVDAEIYNIYLTK